MDTVTTEGAGATDVRRRIAVIASAYNDGPSIGELSSRLTELFDQLPAYDWEAILIDNGSEDDTFAQIELALAGEPRFRVVQLARNFRQDGGFSAGLAAAEADAVVLMRADLSDPPEMIPDFVAQWETGIENVYAVEPPGRESHTGNGRLLGSLSAKLTGGLVPSSAGDFRLLDRRVYEQVRSMEERNRFVQGLVAWVGFRATSVERPSNELRPARSEGGTTERTSRWVRAVFAHSQVPLVLIPLVGIGLAVLAFLALVALSIDWLTRGVPFPGFGTIVALMVMLFGILFCMLGIISIYIGLIFEEAKGRPNFVIRRTVGFGARDTGVVLGTSPNTIITPVPAPVRPEGLVDEEPALPTSTGT